MDPWPGYFFFKFLAASIVFHAKRLAPVVRGRMFVYLLENCSFVTADSSSYRFLPQFLNWSLELSNRLI